MAYDDSGVLALLEELADLLEDSKPVMLLGNFNFLQFDISAGFELIDEINQLFPQEFNQARQIVRQRDEIITVAQEEAERMKEDARNQAMTIASQQEIVRTAQLQADEIMAEAREMERQTRSGAEEYADQVFSHVQGSLEQLLNNVMRCRKRLNGDTPENR